MTSAGANGELTPVRIDCHPIGGVAGDMFAAAMFDAFPSLYDNFTRDLAWLDIEGLQASLSNHTSHSLYAQHFSVVQNVNIKPPRTLPAVIEFLNSKRLDANVIETAIGIYRLLAEAEAAVHGKTIDTVHFHEVSDWDSMVDILAAAGAIARLNCSHWRIGPLPLGGGTITTAHGDIPLPAPATVHLMKGFDWTDDGQPGERVTPTGAAILAYLSPSTLHAGAASATLAAVGVGCGTRQLADRANIFRVCVFNESDNEFYENDVVTQLAFEVDDMTGEEIAQALSILRAELEVLDVCTVAIQGKKGRPGTGFQLLVVPHAGSAVIDQCFRQTTTLGVRHSSVQRKILQRQHKNIDGRRVKVARRPGPVSTAKIESVELAGFSSLTERRAQAQSAERKAIDD